MLGDSNIVGTPLSVLLRDAGAGTVTVCHRIAYNNLFDDRTAPRMRPQLRADACLPRLPGPYSPETDPKEAPWLSTTLPCLDDKSAPHSSATLGVQERASGTTYSLGRDSDRSTQHEVGSQLHKQRTALATVSTPLLIRVGFATLFSTVLLSLVCERSS